MGTRPRTSPAVVEHRVLAAIRQAWKSSGVSQRALAQKSGVTQPQVSRILAGRKGGTITEVAALCGALDLDMADLLRAAEQATDDDRDLAPRTSWGAAAIAQGEAEHARPEPDEDGDDGHGSATA